MAQEAKNLGTDLFQPGTALGIDTGMRLNELLSVTPAYLCMAPGLSVRLAATGTKERARLIPRTARARAILERRGAALDDNDVFFDYPLLDILPFL